MGLALSVGVTVAGILCLLPSDFSNDVARYYMANSLEGGGGHNMVNVIIVDFRGFDTFIEMTVFALTGLILLGFLASPPASGVAIRKPLRSILTQTWAGVMSFSLLLGAIFLLLRGHDAPGGGFIAGLVVVLAYAVQYLAVSLPHRVTLALDGLLALGFMLALITGLCAVVMGAGFLTSTHYRLHLAWLGDIELASAALFDLGVFFVVVAVGRIFLLRFAAWQRVNLTQLTAGREE
jgi:multicomponent K+:H+ antiporter subunit A